MAPETASPASAPQFPEHPKHPLELFVGGASPRGCARGHVSIHLMFIELVDSLRCLQPHEDTWLVATFDRMENRRVIEGALGCPTCRASYPIRAGIAWLGATPGQDEDADGSTLAAADVEDEAMRLAALLDLREPGMRALLVGTHGALAHVLAQATQAELLVVDPPASVLPGEGVSVLRTGGRLPLAAASMRGIALDALAAGAMAAAVAALRDGGRLVAPAHLPVPDAVTELARDARQWVAERDARPSAPVQLRVVRGGQG
jgi:hypothetical protein